MRRRTIVLRKTCICGKPAWFDRQSGQWLHDDLSAIVFCERKERRLEQARYLNRVRGLSPETIALDPENYE